MLAIAHDLAAVALAWFIAYWLRFNLELPEPYSAQALTTALWVVPLYGAIFLASGLYRGIWRFASLPDLQRIILAAGGGALAGRGGFGGGKGKGKPRGRGSGAWRAS